MLPKKVDFQTQHIHGIKETILTERGNMGETASAGHAITSMGENPKLLSLKSETYIFSIMGLQKIRWLKITVPLQKFWTNTGSWGLYYWITAKNTRQYRQTYFKPSSYMFALRGLHCFEFPELTLPRKEKMRQKCRAGLRWMGKKPKGGNSQTSSGPLMLLIRGSRKENWSSGVQNQKAIPCC